MATGNDEEEVTIDLTAEEAEKIEELVRVLFTSDIRIRIFWSIREEERRTKKIANDVVGCSQATVADAKGEFREYGLMEGDELTQLGKQLSYELPNFLRTVLNVQQLKPFVSRVDHFGSVDFWDVFGQAANAEVEMEKKGDATSLGGYKDLIDKSDAVRELVPWRTPRGSDFLNEIESDDLTGEFLFNQSDFENWFDQRPSFYHDLSSAGATLLDTSMQLPDFTLSIFDEQVSLLAGNLSPEVLVTSDDESILDWAERSYETYRSESDQFKIIQTGEEEYEKRYV